MSLWRFDVRMSRDSAGRRSRRGGAAARLWFRRRVGRRREFDGQWEERFVLLVTTRQLEKGGGSGDGVGSGGSGIGNMFPRAALFS